MAMAPSQLAVGMTWWDARESLLLESSSLAAVPRYMGKWNPHMVLEIMPVVEDEEAAVVYGQIAADNNA